MVPSFVNVQGESWAGDLIPDTLQQDSLLVSNQEARKLLLSLLENNENSLNRVMGGLGLCTFSLWGHSPISNSILLRTLK